MLIFILACHHSKLNSIKLLRLAFHWMIVPLIFDLAYLALGWHGIFHRFFVSFSFPFRLASGCDVITRLFLLVFQHFGRHFANCVLVVAASSNWLSRYDIQDSGSDVCFFSGPCRVIFHVESWRNVFLHFRSTGLIERSKFSCHTPHFSHWLSSLLRCR